MSREGRARREMLAALCPPAPLIVDVGADHGHVAHALGAIATERHPRRTGRPDVPWVVADGLAPFRHVPVAVIAGMGAWTIARILDRGPRPDVLIAHAQDDPPRLRQLLVSRGWRIDAEALAPEAGRWAEVIRAVPGDEAATGLTLALGPRLLEGDDPHLRDHLLHTWRFHAALATATERTAPARHAVAEATAAFLAGHLAARGWWPPP